mgnify:CR=1 FL=1
MIKSAYFRERQEYSQDLIASALQIDNAKAKQIIGKLLACNVLKLLKKGQGQTACGLSPFLYRYEVGRCRQLSCRAGQRGNWN